MKRPTGNDELTKKRAAEIYMPAVIKYLGKDWREEDREYTIKQISENLHSYTDGYELARDLERDGWEEDRALVDLGDDITHALSKAEDELVAQWVKIYNISPTFNIGDKVTTNKYQYKDQIGEIYKIVPEQAKYYVRFPGHVPEGQLGTQGTILNYEDVLPPAV